jgi:hypothetical protein
MSGCSHTIISHINGTTDLAAFLLRGMECLPPTMSGHPMPRMAAHGGTSGRTGNGTTLTPPPHLNIRSESWLGNYSNKYGRAYHPKPYRVAKEQSSVAGYSESLVKVQRVYIVG